MNGLSQRIFSERMITIARGTYSDSRDHPYDSEAAIHALAESCDAGCRALANALIRETLDVLLELKELKLDDPAWK